MVYRVFLQPKQLAYLHHTDIHHLDGVIVQAQGYQRSTPVRVPALQRSSDAAGGMERSVIRASCVSLMQLMLGKDMAPKAAAEPSF